MIWMWRGADTMATESKDEQAPLVVVLTGAAGNIAYALSFMIAQGSMFGNRQVRGCVVLGAACVVLHTNG